MIHRVNSVIRTEEVVDLAVVPKSCIHTMLASLRLQESSSLHTNPVRPSSVVSLTNPSYFVEPANIKSTAFFWAMHNYNRIRLQDQTTASWGDGTWTTLHVTFFCSEILSSTCRSITRWRGISTGTSEISYSSPTQDRTLTRNPIRPATINYKGKK